MTKTETKIMKTWRAAGHKMRRVRNEFIMGGGLSEGGRGYAGMYSGSSITNTTGDFLGDWRSADSWERFDLWRVRNRSRQLERGNPWCQSFKTSLINNVLGARGFHRKVDVQTSKAFGDNTEGVRDDYACRVIEQARVAFEKSEQYTTRKKMTARDVDRLLLARLAFDGEIILRKIPGFDNDFNFSWEIIDPDYLDHNLNRIETGYDQDGKKVAEPGNITKMGVELDKTWKYPVAYWFLRRRPNDYFYNYAEVFPDRYYRVSSKEILHIFLQTFDAEQTRGWPWLFAAAVNLHRMGKFEEAALVNAAIGASKMGFFKKTTPEGFVGDETEDRGSIVDAVEPGQWHELPYNVEPVEWNPTYPSSEFEPFSKAMLRSIAASLGISYGTLSNDLSEANFSSLRAGLNEEREQWMQLQEFLIQRWKEPEYEEWLFRALLFQKIPLPLAKFEKFKRVGFTGRRWIGVNPLQDAQTNQIRIANRETSVSAIIREDTGRDPLEVFAEIAEEKRLMDSLGITPADAFPAATDTTEEDGGKNMQKSRG